MKLDRFEKACCGAMLLLATLLGLAAALLAGIGLQPAAPSPVPVYIRDALYLKGSDSHIYRITVSSGTLSATAVD